MITDSPTVVNCRLLEKACLYFRAYLIVVFLTHEPIIK